MQLTFHNDMRYLQFPLLAAIPGVWHGVFARYTVDGLQAKASLNLGLNGGDPESVVWSRRRWVLQTAGARIAIHARQVHGTEVAIWDQQVPADGEVAQDHAQLEGDALITASPGAALVIKMADCQSVLMVDPVRRVVANVHSGWRGSIANVVGRTVQVMMDRFNCRPQDLVCGIGPSLGPCCAEFVHYQKEFPKPYWTYRRPGDLFDFWRLSVDQLMDKGVPREQIAVSNMCTRCNPQLFFTYRGEGQKAGRFAAVIMLEELADKRHLNKVISKCSIGLKIKAG